MHSECKKKGDVKDSDRGRRKMDTGQKSSKQTEANKVFGALIRINGGEKRNNSFHSIDAKSQVLPRILWVLGQCTVLKVLSVMEAI